MSRYTLMSPNLEEADDSPDMDEWGFFQMDPLMDEAETFEALTDPDDSDAESEMAPGEADIYMDKAAPLSEEERAIINETPFLNDRRLMMVDASEHDDRLIEQSLLGPRAMDVEQRDAMYGSDEERMDLSDTDDLGLSFKRLRRGLRKGLRKGLTTYNPAYQAARYTGKGALYAGKRLGKLLTYAQRKIIRKKLGTMAGRRARYLAWQKRGTTVPTPEEKVEAKQWSKNWLRTKGGKFGKVLAAMAGDGFVGGSSFVGIEPVTAALLGMSIPVLIMLLNKMLGAAGKSGAPANPEGAPQGEGGEGRGGEGEGEGEGESASAETTPSSEDEASGEKIADSILGRWDSGRRGGGGGGGRGRGGRGRGRRGGGGRGYGYGPVVILDEVYEDEDYRRKRI